MSRCLVISGATKGIGRSIAMKFAAEGYSVATCSRNQDDLDNFLLEMKKLNSKGSHLAVKADLRKKSDCNSFGKACLDSFSEISVLVNNAGVFLPGNVLSEEDGTLEKLIETNLYSAYYLTRSIAERMIENKRGHIFNISSVAGIQAYEHGGSYSISKFAMQGLGKVLRKELMQHNISVTNLVPGATYTDSWSSAGIDRDRFMEPEDLAKIIFTISQLPARTVVEEVILRPMKGDI